MQSKRTLEFYERLHEEATYHEDYGTVLWWHIPVCEPPVVSRPGTLGDDGEEIIQKGWHTHFSHIPIVYDGDGLPKLEVERAE